MSSTTLAPASPMSPVKHPRGVERLIVGQATSDGAGVKLTRVLTQDLQKRLDPYLMLDHFGSDQRDDYIAGFPDHPHRGFETITFMLAGRMRHRDSAGHEGLLGPGGVQWMTAGRGVIHSELPEQEEGLMSGFQLWLNLPSGRKMAEPWYRDFVSEQIPVFERKGVTVRVIAGHSHGVDGAVQRESTEPLYLDLELPAGSRFEQSLPGGHNAFVFVYEGEARVGDGAGARMVPSRRMAILEGGSQGSQERDGVVIGAGSAPARALLIAGRPLGEPIVQYGPFVMNTPEQIYQAVDDFRNGRLA